MLDTPNEQAPQTPVEAAPEPASAPDTAPQPEPAPAPEQPTEPPKDAPQEPFAPKVPDGMPVDTVMAEAYTKFAADNNLDPKTAQAVVDFYANHVQGQSEAKFALQKQWREELVNDPNLGKGSIDTLRAELERTNAAIRRFAPEGKADEIFGILNDTGLGDHPSIVRMFVNMARAVGEDSITPQAMGKAEAVSTEDFYNGLFKKG